MYSRPFDDNSTEILAGETKPSNLPPTAASKLESGALAKRNKPSGSAPQRRCTSPNSQFSPRLSNRIINSGVSISGSGNGAVQTAAPSSAATASIGSAAGGDSEASVAGSTSASAMATGSTGPVTDGGVSACRSRGTIASRSASNT